MQYNSDYVAVVNRLFDKTYHCELTKVSLSLLNKAPIDPEEIKSLLGDTGTMRLPDGTMVSEANSNQQGLIDMLFKSSRYGLGDEWNQRYNVNQIEQTNLSAASIAELVYMRGSITLVRSTDSVVIHSDIIEYLSMLEQKSIYEPHFRAPPTEDIAAFKTLLSLIENMAAKYEGDVYCNAPFAQLRNMYANTAVGQLVNLNEKVQLNGKTGVSRLFVDTATRNDGHTSLFI